jgi:cytochrome b
VPRDAPGGPFSARVWDIPIRTVHWLLAILIAFSWWSAKSDHLSWHRMSGYFILGLLVFRLLWGFVGSPTARFARFLKGPGAVAAYVRGRAPTPVGHNPLGGWSVLALLTVTAVQVGLGLFSVDEDSIEAGPLSSLVSFDAGRAIAHLHHRLFWVLVGLIVLHLAAIAVYALQGKNLVKPMVTGIALVASRTAVPPLARPWRAIPVAAVALGVAWFLAHGLKF